MDDLSLEDYIDFLICIYSSTNSNDEELKKDFLKSLSKIKFIYLNQK